MGLNVLITLGVMASIGATLTMPGIAGIVPIAAISRAPSACWAVDCCADANVGVMAAAAIIFFAFYGFDAIATAAEEAKNPDRDLAIG